MKQIEKMKELYRAHSPNEEKIIREYAAAEIRGEVRRRSNVNGLDAHEYARALYLDGIRKGWIQG